LVGFLCPLFEDICGMFSCEEALAKSCLPHFEQNVLPVGKGFPQAEQNILHLLLHHQ